jgi:hypothetical protein
LACLLQQSFFFAGLRFGRSIAEVLGFFGLGPGKRANRTDARIRASGRIRYKDHPENEYDNQTSKDNDDLPSRANLPEHCKTLL